MAMTEPNAIERPAPVISVPEPARPTLLKSRTETSEAFSTTSTIIPEPCYDIEHAPVKNDPREWSSFRKNSILALIAFASLIASLSSNIQNPAVEEMEADLPATSSQFSLSISMFSLVQGLMPLLWSAISEVKGRKLVYLTSIALFSLGSIIVALSRHIGPVIGFRVLQAAGSSAVMAIGAASLADIFDPEERGRKMGIYYAAPLLGPALGPVFGGILTSVWGWRAIFWFLALVSGTIFFAFAFFFQDTYRRERSLVYQKVLKQRLSNVPVPKTNVPSMTGRGCLKANKSDVNIAMESTGSKEMARDAIFPVPTPRLSITDVNPFKPLFLVVRRKNNFLVLLSSGLFFGYNLLVVYATSRTLATSYHYSPLKIGLVTLSFGAGCISGSVLGGHWSDRQLAALKAANGGNSYPEMRLKSTLIGICLLPPFVLGFGWLCQATVHISAICIFLFLEGFFSIWIYCITLAYIVDANTGMSSTAVAANSAFRGLAAFVGTEVAVPLQDGLGDGWLYTVWAAVLAFSGVCMLLVWWKGAQWRIEAQARETENETR
ncbi:hypothetical protein GALMADRAFT_155380 [Galerina marginata CBS 339.88]|uniref:Major facilitator superfamily (MFS) profile domain-containing protein n=1 Tax=Galerina marginata (strain CBS 339.88) TaxID=685588 RepID=A0A067TC53_GALM3|nr:hypothetical protein GALMADRAFT_155380 [Galerina marginata CBS 339.88]